MKREFSVSVELRDRGDSRIQALCERKIGVITFLESLRPEERFCLRDGVLVELTPEEFEERKRADRRFRRRHRNPAEGISTDVLRGKKDIFLYNYPDLAGLYCKLEAELAVARCRGCALRRLLAPLRAKLAELVIRRPMQDVSQLTTVLDKDILSWLQSGKVTAEPVGLAPLARIFSSSSQKAAVPPALASLPQFPARPGPTMAGADDQNKAVLAQTSGKPLLPPPAQSGPRPYTPRDCLVHLQQAMAAVQAGREGRVDAHWLAIGHLAEAAEEVLAGDPATAAELRTERLLLMQDPDYTPNLDRFVKELAAQPALKV